MQVYSDFEWIVVDGGSTDRTVEIIKRYSDQLSVLITGKDTGIYDAMNKGLARATGDYVIFMNGGDGFFSDQVLKRFIEQLEIENCDIYYGDQMSDRGFLSDFSQVKLNRGHFYCSKKLAHQACFIKRTLFDIHGPYDPTYKISGDSDFFTRAFASKRPPSSAYLGFAVSLFNSNGISCRDSSWAIMDAEYARMNKKYFTWEDSIRYFIPSFMFMIKRTMIRTLVAFDLFEHAKTAKNHFLNFVRK